jgi:hypothetical protein
VDVVTAQVGLALLAVVALATLPWVTSTHLAGSPAGVQSAYGKLPLSFVANRGQIDGRVRYYAQGSAFSFYFTKDKAVLAFRRGKREQVLDLHFLRSNPNLELEAGAALPGRVNYLKGSDPSRWHTGLETFRRLTYRNLWPGIDMAFRGRGESLSYEFVVHPGARISDIGLAYRGADGLALSRTGRLLIRTPLGVLTDDRPRTFQRIGGRRIPLRSRYFLTKGGNAYGFRLGSSYDSRHAVVIDPVLAYSTYLGGAGSDEGAAIAVDAAGNAYVTGQSDSLDFPTTVGALDTSSNGLVDTFVTKLNASGSAPTYSTYLGGAGNDEGAAIAVDASGSAYVTGQTDSSNFPTTAGAPDTSLGGTDDGFVTKLNASGSGLAYSTYLGGAGFDEGLGLAVDTSGNAYVVGQADSTDFPTTAGAFDTTSNGGYDTVVAKLNSSGSALAYSTYLGGTKDEEGRAIAVDAAGNAYVTGRTDGSGFPTTAGAFDTSSNGMLDVFVTKLNASGSGLAYSTYLGGGGNDRGRGIAVDASGSAYVTGFISSSDFPITTGAFDTSYNANRDAFVTKLNASGSGLAYSTYLGGAGEDQGRAIAVDASGNAYATGYTVSSDFPITSAGAVDPSFNGGLADAFATKLNATGSGLAHSTYLGGAGEDNGAGIAIDTGGSAYVTGQTDSTNFPTTAGALDTSLSGIADAFVAKIITVVSYPRPGAATPLRVPLVPSFRSCAAPNSTHAAPLGYPSCNPPALESSVGTTSTIGKGAGLARLDAIAGDPTTTADEADVVITASATDVRCALAGAPNCGADGVDYAGKVILSTTIRITDRANGQLADEASTVQDAQFSVPIDCLASSDTSLGASCSVSTSSDTLLPGFAKEGKRMVISAFSVKLLDAGPDGTITPSSGSCPIICGSGDEKVFMVQGLFAP